MGHIAGFASSVTGGFSTVIAAILASVVNQFFDGTPLPLIISCFLMVYLAWIVARHLPYDIPDNPKKPTYDLQLKKSLKNYKAPIHGET